MSITFSVACLRRGSAAFAPTAGTGPLAALSLADSHGVWLGSLSGLWLLQPDGKFLKVTAAPVYALGDRA